MDFKISSSLLKESTRWKKVFSFDEIHGVPGDQSKIGLPRPNPPPPRVEKGVLNYSVADKTPDFIVNLLSLGCRTSRNKS